MQEKNSNNYEKKNYHVQIIGIVIAIITLLFGSGIVWRIVENSNNSNNNQSEVIDNNSTENTYNNNYEVDSESESINSDNPESNSSDQKPSLPQNGTNNLIFEGRGIDLLGCKITFFVCNENAGYAPYKETVLYKKYDGSWLNIDLPNNIDIYFCAWEKNELVGSSYGGPIYDNTNCSIAIFSSEKMGIPVFLKFEGKNSLNISGCMITMTINDSTTLNTSISDSYNGESIVKFVKPGNYELSCWKDNILIAKTKWNFDDAWSIHTVYFYPLN